MAEAIALSHKGFPAPNPRVGAVVVAGGKVVGRGWHEASGHPHAEVVALRSAGFSASGSDLYVTLEPCAHHGKTPPCVEAIIEAGVNRVIYAVRDPNPEAAGGAERLGQNGVTVVGGVMTAEAAAANLVFTRRWFLQRPYVLVKAAVTLDGRIADRRGKSQWITGEAARKRAQFLRAEMGCVLVGAGTIEKDDPSLTVRQPEFQGPQPMRVILDPYRRLPQDSRVFTEDNAVTLRVVASQANHDSEWQCPMVNEEFDLKALLSELGRRGMIGVLVEGGGKTIEPFFRARLADALELHVAPKIFGAGLVWAEGRGVESLPEAWKLTALKHEPLGDGLRIWGDVED
jgi:diaminohydroxyphosphoribosylaminopyrimidine deaminase/5-amino-6-(5-phosphoribosylamino)uracil reductase